MIRGFAATGRSARKLARIAASLTLASAFVAIAAESTQTAIANGDTRTLSFYHTHSHEKITVTFKKDGRYDQAGLKKLNHFLRDWRNQKATNMEPRLFDVVWEVQKDAGSKAAIHIISAFRSPETNEKLRSRSKGVAKNSQHTLGRAMDIHLPDVNMAKIREAGLRLQRGGVGFYPTSAKPFVHLDVGTVRHWPRMTRDQLVRLFPDGRTVHLPTDGVPLKNYQLAMADVAKNGGVVRGMSETQMAEAKRNQSKDVSRGGSGSGFIAKLLAGDDEDDAPATTPAPDVTTPDPAPVAPAAPEPAAAAVAIAEAVVPLPAARPAEITAGPQLASAYAPQGLPAGPEMIWRSGADAHAGRAATTYDAPATTPVFAAALPMPRPAGTTPAALTAHAAPKTIEPADMPVVTASLGSASLADQREAALRLLGQLREPPPVAEEAPVTASRIAAAFDSFGPVPAQAPVVKPQRVAKASVKSEFIASEASFSPSRSARNRDLPLNHPNFERAGLIAAPAAILPTNFGGNPNSGMRSDIFNGNAISVLRTVSFGPQRTALLGPRN